MLDYSRLKPGVKRPLHLFTASFLWSGIGVVLMLRGWFFLEDSSKGWFLLAAVVIGTLKSRFILDKSFRRNIQRILGLKDGACLGAVYSRKLWALVVVMMLSGYVLRTTIQPGQVIGTIYFAIGWGLLLSSRHGWTEWFRYTG